MIKPPYRVPLMDEIKALAPNGFNAVSTFSGCGGSSLGYKMAGFKMLWANEFIPAAQDTYRLNHPDTILDTRDIRNVTGASLLDAIGLGVGEIDLFDGSPPCASFSTAGKREAGWGKVKAYSDTKQRTDDLFHEYARLIKETQPKVFVAENVSGLVKGTAKGYFLEILKALKACGYEVGAKLLDAQWLGVPQMRQRVIFVGVRNDLVARYNVRPVWPKPLPYFYSVRDALPWVSKLVQTDVYDEGERVTTDSPTPSITVSGLGAKRIDSHYVEAETDISRYAIGAEWDNLKIGEQSGKYFSLVTGQGGDGSLASVVHPTEKRKFSIAELKRIGGFPDDFQLTGTFAQQWERIGRAVPPVMMAKIAATVRDEILCKIQ